MKAERLWNIRFVQLVLIEALFQFGAYMTNPIVSGYAVALGASIAVGGLLAGLSASMALVARPLTGWLADRLAKRSFLLIAAALFCVSAFGCALATSVVLIGLFRVLAGVAFAFRSAAVIALVSLAVPPARLGQAVGWTGIAQTVSCALGPAAGALVIGAAGYAASFAAAGVLFSAGFLLCLAVREPRAGRGAPGVSRAGEGAAPARGPRASGSPAPTSGRGVRARLRSIIYLPNVPIALMAGLSIVPHGVAVTLLLTAGEMRGIAGVSAYFAVYAAAALVSKPTAGRLTDRWGMRRVAAPALAVELVGTVLLALMASLPAVLVAAACMGVGQASAYSAIQAEAVRGVPACELGRASNTFYIGTDVGMGFGPMALGVVLQLAGVTAMFLAGSVLVLLALGTLAAYHPSKPKG